MNLMDLKCDTPEKQMAVKNCQALFTAGSVLYGTNIVGKSDQDYVGWFFPDEKYNGLGLDNIEQVQFSTKSSGNNRKNTVDDLDCTLYSFNKYIKLLLNSNPNTLETLFINKNCINYLTPLGKMVMDNYELFINKKCFHSFSGYVMSQMHRLERNGQNGTGRQELISLYQYDTKMFSHCIRLYVECIELLSNHTITFPLKENKNILLIKTGQWDFEKAMEEANRLKKLCDEVYANSTLQYSPNFEEISKLVINMNKEFYGYNYKNTNKFSKLFADFLRNVANKID